MDPPTRRAAYSCDVTYGTNNEFGFDYLRDNMAPSMDTLVQRGHNYAIVDEVDSILIDEARTPLIISGQAEESTEKYALFARVAQGLVPEQDFTVDEKAKTVALTEQGVDKVERWLNIENLYDEENIELNHHVNAALKARMLMKRDRDYIVKDGEVIIVDEFTGRLMFGRRYSDGLHQAIEAKEGVRVQRESQTWPPSRSRTTSGCNEAGRHDRHRRHRRSRVHQDIRMPVRADPHGQAHDTAGPARHGLQDRAGQVQRRCRGHCGRHAKGQPVLSGTVSIEKSELLSEMLKRRGIPHQVLNAKHHEREAEIIKLAGHPAPSPSPPTWLAAAPT